MRFRWLASALFFLTALLACGEIISHTYIKVGEQFVLGGWQRGTFRVKARNSGPVPVSVAERRASGAVQERGRLAPGPAAALACGAGSALLVRNLGNRTAETDAKITGDVSTGMGMAQEALK